MISNFRKSDSTDSIAKGLGLTSRLAHARIRAVFVLVRAERNDLADNLAVLKEASGIGDDAREDMTYKYHFPNHDQSFVQAFFALEMHAKMVFGLVCLIFLVQVRFTGWMVHPQKPENCIKDSPKPPCPEGWEESKKNPEKCRRVKDTDERPSPPCPEGWIVSKRNPEKCRKVKPDAEE
eukprot:maker-scaffold1327_size47512-snap-gene-0.6 protein:Tk07302 transcript:maker-scaffold1327_size47512-snap-gene-0.6-mRNA-1 annotation:"atp-dependent metalloprotease"